MKVSIIIPVYNAQNTIRKAIDSALNQDFSRKDFEIIVVNDGSTDKTLEILKTYGRKIRVINQKNQGAVKAANKGFRKAKGKYVIKLDADDYFKQNILREMVTVLDRKLKLNFVYCDYYEKEKGKKMKIVSTKNIFNTLAGGVMFRKKDLAKEGFYKEDIKLPEYDLLLKIQKKWIGYRLPFPLFQYNRHKRSISKKKNYIKEALIELEKMYPKKKKEIQKIRSY